MQNYKKYNFVKFGVNLDPQPRKASAYLVLPFLQLFYMCLVLCLLYLQDHKNWKNMKKEERRLRHIIDHLDGCTQYIL